MSHDMNTLIERSKELSKELSQRNLTPAEARWGARIALVEVPENDLGPRRWWQTRARWRRLAKTRQVLS